MVSPPAMPPNMTNGFHSSLLGVLRVLTTDTMNFYIVFFNFTCVDIN